MASGICTSRLPPRLFPSLQQYNTASRSEEHTSELQSQSNIVCRLLLEKKKANGVHPQGVAADNRQGCHGQKTTTRSGKEAQMRKLTGHTLGARYNHSQPLSSRSGPNPL